MPTQPKFILREELVRRAKAKGVRFGRNPNRDLGSRASEGVIPRGRRIGKGRGKGCEVVYPESALPRLVAAEKLRQQGIPYKDMGERLDRELPPSPAEAPPGGLTEVVGRLSKLVITHWDEDHISNLWDAIQYAAANPPDIPANQCVKNLTAKIAQIGVTRLVMADLLPSPALDALDTVLVPELEQTFSEFRSVAGFAPRVVVSQAAETLAVYGEKEQSGKRRLAQPKTSDQASKKSPSRKSKRESSATDARAKR